MKDYAKRVNLPPDTAINGGLTAATSAFMVSLFGEPSTKKTVNCSEPTNKKLLALMVTDSVGPFRCTGIKPAMDSLKRIFAKVKAEKPELYEAIQTAGMKCCRGQRTNINKWSNHSFGTGIDLYCGTSVVPQGVELTQQGVLELYPYFHNEGWYWGAEFSLEDAMHFDASVELLTKWKKAKLI